MIEKLIFILSVLGAIDSIYTALQQIFGNLFEFCFNREFKRVSCNEVLHSKYAKIFLVPNSWLGFAFYLLLAFTYYSNWISYKVGALVSLIGLVFSYYLLYVQGFVLKKFCIFCLISTFLITLISILSLILVLY